MSAKKRSMPDLQDRVDELVVWARSRIEHCRREEQKFGAGSVAIDASQERRTLEAVLRIAESDLNVVYELRADEPRLRRAIS